MEAFELSLSQSALVGLRIKSYHNYSAGLPTAVTIKHVDKVYDILQINTDFFIALMDANISE